MPMFAISNIATAFQDYAIETSTEELGIFKAPGESYCLADYIQAWVKSGKGVQACLGDWQTFTLVVIAIISHWHEDPTITDYVTDGDPETGEGCERVERRAHSIFGDRGFEGHDITDPLWFATLTFHELNGERS